MLLALSFGFVSCDVETNEDAGGTNVEKMAGHWTVTFEQSVDEYNAIANGGTNPGLSSMTADQLEKLKWADAYGMGKVGVYSYNTASNAADSIWFSDYATKASDASTWSYKLKVGINYGTKTFGCAETSNTNHSGCSITIIGGKILKDAARTPRGAVADSIIAFVKFSNNSDGFTFMKMSGYRYTGFSADN